MPRRVDLLIAGGLLIWRLPDVPWWWEHPGHRESVPAILGALALSLVMSVPFCWRRRFQLLALAAAAAVLAVREVLHHDRVSAFAAVLVAAYGVGSFGHASRRCARGLGWACDRVHAVVFGYEHSLAGPAPTRTGRRRVDGAAGRRQPG